MTIIVKPGEGDKPARIDCPKCGTEMWHLENRPTQSGGIVIVYRCSKIGCGHTELIDPKRAPPRG